MRKQFKLTIGAVLAAAATLLLTVQLPAQPVVGGPLYWRVRDLGVTNMVDATKSIVLAPTNTATWFNTGFNADVSDVTDIGIEVRATVVSTNTTDLLVIRMVRASVNSVPVGGDFEEDVGSSAWSFAVPAVTTGTPAAPVTNSIVWHTNPPALWLRGATHLGVGGITNSALPLTSSAATVTNSQAMNVKVSLVKGDRVRF